MQIIHILIQKERNYIEIKVIMCIVTQQMRNIIIQKA